MSQLYDLPDGWELKTLGNVGKITTGNTPSKKESTFWDNENGEYLFVKPPHLGTDIPVKDTEEKLTNDGFLKAKPIPKNSIMVCCIGSLGKIGIADRELATNQQINSISFYDDIVDFKFGYYFTTTLERKMNQIANKAVVSIINKSTFSKIEFPLPPLSEQQRIVSKLDNLFEKIDKAIELHQKNIYEANVFMGSVLNDVFGELEEKYEKKSIGSFSKVGTGVTPLKSRDDYYKNGNINWITSKATNDDLVYESEQLVTDVALRECRLKLNPIGTLIVALYGQGKTRGQVSELMIETTTNQALATILVDDKQAINRYLKYFLKKSYLDLREKASGGTQPNLNLTIIKNTELPFPPKKIQDNVVAYLDEISEKIEKVKSIQKEKMENLKALKASILDKAFKGKL